MLPTPVLSVSGKGFARLRVSAWHFSPAPPILYAVRAIVYHKSRVLSRVLRDFSGSEAPGTPRLNPRGTCCPCRCGVRRGLNPSGTGSPCHCGNLNGGLPRAALAIPAFGLLFCPLSPSPLPRWGRGRFLVYFAGGFAPGTPALDRLRHLQSLPSGHPAQGACGCPQKRQEAVPYEQCRQPRRGGTGGEELSVASDGGV